MSGWIPIIPFFLWASLLLPGYAIARRLLPDELESGPIAGIAVCACSFMAFLLPILALLYIVGAPTWILSGILLGSVVWGLFDTIRHRTWKSLSGVLAGVIGLEVLALLVDVVMSERVGSILAADARVHVARIRFLLEQGLSNQDPYVPDPAFYPIYHTNMLHGLMAGLSRLSGLDPLIIWYGSLGVAKVLIASGIGYLTWAILPSRWAMAVAILFVVIARGPVTFSIYPNQLAPWFLFPVVMAVCIRSSEWSMRRAFIIVLAAALLIGSFHGLYAGFSVLLGSTVLGVMVIWRLARGSTRRSARSPMIALCGLLLGGMVYPVVSHVMTIKPGPRQERAAERRVSEQESQIRAMIQALKERDKAGADADAIQSAPDQGIAPVDSEFEPVQDAKPEVAVDYTSAPVVAGTPQITLTEDQLRQRMMNWRLPKYDGFARKDGLISRELGRGQTGAWRSKHVYVPAWRVLVILLGMLAAGFLLKRVQPFELLAALILIHVIMGVPSLCTAAYLTLGEFWMVLRFETLSEVLWIVLAVPPLAMAMEKRVRYRALQWLITLILLPIGIRHAYFKSPYDWSFYANRAAQVDRIRHKRELLPLLNLSRRLESALPAGAVIATHPYHADYLGMLVDASFLVSERSSSGVEKLGVRKRSLKSMLSSRIEEEERGAYFKEFGVTHVVMGDRIHDWIPLWASEVGRVGRWKIAPVWEEPDFTRVVLRDMRRGLKAMRRDEFTRATLAFERVVAEEPLRDDIWFRLGNARLWSDDPGGAVEAYDEVVRLDPTNVDAWLMLGNAYQSQGRLDEAEAIYTKTIEIGQEIDDLPIAASAAYNLGNIFYRARNWEEAITYYDIAIALNPWHRHAPTFAKAARSQLESSRGSDESPATP
jgi:tetratricopeptide (TPR) repeat protein